MTVTVGLLSSLLRAISNELLTKGGLTPEAHAAVHKIAAEADGRNTGRDHQIERLSPLKFCVVCKQWVQNPCIGGAFE